jgi:hypothetical protein
MRTRTNYAGPDTIVVITGRRVRAFISGMDASQDVSCEVFYLEPREPG